MFFNALINVRITSATTGVVFNIETVHDVEIKNDIKQIGTFAKIEVPINCLIQYNNGQRNLFQTVIPYQFFASGDTVTITAQYEGYPLKTLFQGYVYDFTEGMPTVIKCQDGIYLLNQTTLNLTYATTTLQTILATVLKGTGITVMPPPAGQSVFDINLVDITFTLCSPAAILEYFKKNIGLHVSVIGKQLYVNVAGNVNNIVNLDSSINVIGCSLQKPDAVYSRIKVKAWFVKENGTKDSIEVGDPNGTLEEVYFYKIPDDVSTYQMLAEQALVKYKQFKYSGGVELLLYPDVDIYWSCNYNDVSYPDRSGVYYIVSVVTTCGDGGYRQKLKMSFLET